jgi:hypothetical protein
MFYKIPNNALIEVSMHRLMQKSGYSLRFILIDFNIDVCNPQEEKNMDVSKIKMCLVFFKKEQREERHDQLTWQQTNPRCP